MTKRDRNLVFVAMILIWTMGLWNYIFSSIGFSAWKQLMLVGLFILSFKYIVCVEKEGVRYAGISIVLIFLCAFYSIVMSVGVGAVLFNVWFYIAWVPFYIIFSMPGWLPYLTAKRYFLLAVLIVGAAGMLIDVYSGYFSFLSANEESAAYALNANIAQRSAFWFVASTLAVPAACGVALLLEIIGVSVIISCVNCVCIFVCAYAAGSLSGIAVAVLFYIGVFAAKAINSVNKISILMAFFVTVACGFFVMNFLSDSTQFARIFDNTYSDSEANSGRLNHWSYSIVLISDFSLIEHLFGLGIGVTNDQHNPGFVLDTHGESSFIQAYLEGGVAATLVRLAPFLLIIRVFFAGRFRAWPLVFLYVATVFFAVALAPTFGATSIQMILGIVAGIGYSYLPRRDFLVQ